MCLATKDLSVQARHPLVSFTKQCDRVYVHIDQSRSVTSGRDCPCVHRIEVIVDNNRGDSERRTPSRSDSGALYPMAFHADCLFPVRHDPASNGGLYDGI
jgi:hypothetical protein